MREIDVLGNAYLTNYFVNVGKLEELQNALKAYNQAVSRSSSHSLTKCIGSPNDYQTARSLL